MDMPLTLVGLGGWAKSGKDAVADTLADIYSWIKEYMSRPLEEALLRVNPWIDTHWSNWMQGTYPHVPLTNKPRFMRYRELHALVGYDASKNNHDVRDYLQKLGTEVGREMCDQDVWVRWAFGEVDKHRAAGHRVAITGIRYPNELEWLKGRGGQSVWVSRPGYGPVNSHSSDNTLGPDDFDMIIENDGTLTDLTNKVMFIFDPGVAA